MAFLFNSDTQQICCTSKHAYTLRRKHNQNVSFRVIFFHVSIRLSVDDDIRLIRAANCKDILRHSKLLSLSTATKTIGYDFCEMKLSWHVNDIKTSNLLVVDWISNKRAYNHTHTADYSFVEFSNYQWCPRISRFFRRIAVAMMWK